MVAWGVDRKREPKTNPITLCTQCLRVMVSPDVSMPAVCNDCLRANHRRLAGIARDRVRRDRVANKWR